MLTLAPQTSPAEAPPRQRIGRDLRSKPRYRLGSNIPGLDGMRGIAALAIVWFHIRSHSPGLHLLNGNGGYLAVDAFFVMSGFLITALLLSEFERTETVSFKYFYARRALRLLPALFVVLTAVTVYCALDRQNPVARYTLHAVPWIIGYAGNWHMILHDRSQAWVNILIPTWSLAVEEQFYLLWPCVFLVVARHARSATGRFLVAGFLLYLAAVETWWRWHLMRHGANFIRLYYGSDTHSDGLIVGCALAFILSGLLQYPRLMDRLKRPAAVMAVVATASVPFLYLYADYSLAWSWLWTPVGCVAAAAIVASLALGPPPVLSSILEHRAATWVGKRSYALYLWHFPIIVLSQGLHPGWARSNVVRDALLIAIPLAVAALSYRFVEQPFLRRKRRFNQAPRDSRLAVALREDPTAPVRSQTIQRKHGRGTKGSSGRPVLSPTSGGSPKTRGAAETRYEW